MGRGWIAVLAPASLALATLAAPALARDNSGDRGGRPHSRGFANPSALIAAELAVERVAQTRGLWLAFRDSAAPGAMLAAPQPTAAEPFLKNRTEPKSAMAWQVHEVWSSCDGSYGVTRGTFHGAQGAGRFITVWQRQEKDGGYKWLLRQERALAAPPPEPEMIGALVADCPKPSLDEPPAPPPAKTSPQETEQLATPQPIDPLDASSDDGTLSWTAGTGPDGSPYFALTMKRQGEMRQMLGTN